MATTDPNTDLDVDDPTKVARILRNAVEQYRESASELASAWQDNEAGSVWAKLARILDRAADQCDKTTDRFVEFAPHP